MPLLASNFTSNLLYGTTIVAGGWANVNLNVDKFAFEGDKTFVVKLRKDSTLGQVLGTSAPITIKDYTTIVSLTANTATVNEGNLVQFTLTTTNVVNYTNVAYSVFPVTANVTSADFVANTGYITIINDVGTFALQANADLTLMDETGEVFRVQIRDRNNTNNYISSNITIVDTSKTYNIISLYESANTVFEDNVLTFTLTGHNIPAGTILYYTTTGNAIVSQSTGSFVVNGLSNTIAITPIGIPTLESRVVSLQIRTDSTSGPIISTSNSVICLDSAYAYSSATGGTELNLGDGYKSHIFTTSSSFVVSTIGRQYSNFDYLVVAGGGGGGYGSATNYLGGGGGGAGGLIQGSNAIITSSGTYNIVVGGGGAGGPSSPAPLSGGSRGGNSYIVIGGANTQIAVGGGGGCGEQDTIAATPGGSGGGAGYSALPAGSGVAGQGNPGGRYWSPQLRTAGGGGGAGSRGYAFDDNSGGNVNGGIGLAVNFINFSAPAAYGQPGPAPAGKYFAGGGGGGKSPAEGGTRGIGGIGGGGEGGSGTPGFSGNVYSGGGGGGGSYSTGGTGGSGLVIIRYPYNVTTYSNLLLNSGNIQGITANISYTMNALNANTKTFYYTTDGNVTISDFIGGNTGSFIGNVSGGNITLRANATIPAGEQRKFLLQIREGSTTGQVVLTSANLTIGNYSDMFITATGGNVYQVGGYRTHVFTTSNSFIVTSAPALTSGLEVLIIGGGGGGGGAYPSSPNTPNGSYTQGGGGGGAGGLYYRSNLVVTANTYTVTIGAGGSLGTDAVPGGNGANTIVFGINALGGGGGGGTPDGGNRIGNSGGNGGGSVGNSNAAGGANVLPVVQGWSNYGFPGGGSGATSYGAAGGGGAAGAGNPTVNQPGNTYPGSGGKGGDGISMPMLNGTPIGFGANKYVAAGGGGGELVYQPGAATGGADGAGGRSYGGSQRATAGLQNHGGGGGGAASLSSNVGGSGVVVIRYPYA